MPSPQFKPLNHKKKKKTKHNTNKTQRNLYLTEQKKKKGERGEREADGTVPLAQ
jgi:hypothetical protein